MSIPARSSVTVLTLCLLMVIVSSWGTQTAYASTVGRATSCSSLAICNYTINSGAGSASTNAGISGYVGQNFTFSGGSITFKLPGETLTSSDAGVYSGKAINTKVFSSTVGLIYKVTGTFAAADYNTGKIVKGSTIGFVGISGHSGRGGGIYYKLVNGSISFSLTSQYATVLSVNCTPTSLTFGSSTTCIATVTDLIGTSIPTGKVTFSSSLGFSPTTCVLSSGVCSVTIFPTAGTWPVYASYGGDSSHYTSSARGPELYVSCPPDGC